MQQDCRCSWASNRAGISGIPVPESAIRALIAFASKRRAGTLSLRSCCSRRRLKRYVTQSCGTGGLAFRADPLDTCVKACPKHPRGLGAADKLLRRALDVINRAWPTSLMRELRAWLVLSYSNECHYSDHKRNGYLMSPVARDVDAPQRFRVVACRDEYSEASWHVSLS